MLVKMPKIYEGGAYKNLYKSLKGNFEELALIQRWYIKKVIAPLKFISLITKFFVI